MSRKKTVHLQIDCPRRWLQKSCVVLSAHGANGQDAGKLGVGGYTSLSSMQLGMKTYEDLPSSAVLRAAEARGHVLLLWAGQKWLSHEARVSFLTAVFQLP